MTPDRGATKPGMLKVVWVCRYDPSWDRERANRYWRTHHAALGRRVPLMRSYQQNILLEPITGRGPAAGGPLAIDGFSMSWYDDAAGFATSASSPEMAEMDRDAQSLFSLDDIWGGWSASLEETATDLSGTPPIEQFKVGWVSRYRADLRRDDAHDRWVGEHGALLDAVPGLRRHVENHAVEPIGPQGLGSGPPLAFDAITELWFDDRPAWLRALETPEWARVLEDAGTLFDLDMAWAGHAGVVDHAWIIE